MTSALPSKLVSSNSVVVDIHPTTLTPSKPPQQIATLQGRTIAYPPTSFDEDKKKVAIVCSLTWSAVCLFGGALTWGICNDPNKSGCSQSLHDAGEAFTIIGILWVSAECCIACCMGILQVVASQNTK